MELDGSRASLEWNRGRIALVSVLAAGSFLGCPSASEDEAQVSDAQLDRLRALPYVEYAAAEPDEPEGVVVHERELAHPGYTLVTTRPLRRADLIDTSGNVLRSWQADETGVWERAELLDSGELLVVGTDHEGKPWPDDSRYLMKFDWEGNVLWRKRIEAHHDVELTPEGKLALLTFERRLIPDIHPRVETRDDGIALLDPKDGKVVDNVSFYEVFSKAPDGFSFQEVKPFSYGPKPWVDLFHSNSLHWIHQSKLASVDEIYRPGNVLVSMRHQDAIVIFDWDERELLWSWGQGVLSGPHDAQVLSNGHIIVFDNGLERGWSRVLEVDPLRDEIVWEYSGPDPFYTRDRGSAQRLANGNTLIAESNSGVAFEVTPDGEIVWRYVNPHKGPDGRRASIVRAIRHERDRIETLLTQRRGGQRSSSG